MTWRDAVGNTSPHDLVRQLAVAPVADWSARAARLLTGQRQDLAYLLSTQTWLDAGSRCIRQPACDTHLIERYAAPTDPASPPEPHRLNIHRDLLGNSRIAVPHCCQQYHPRAPHQRLARLVGTHQAFELTVLRVAQLNLRRPRSRHALHLVSKMVHPSRPPQSSGSPPPFCTSGFVIGTSRPTPARAAVKLSTKKGCVVRVIHVPIREGLSGILIAMKPFSGTSRGMWRPSDRDATHLERRTPGNGYAVSSLA